MPIYGILNLSITSQPRGQSSIVLLRDPARLVAAIPALIPGCFLVAVLASLPFKQTFLCLLLDAHFRSMFPHSSRPLQLLATKAIRRLAVRQYQDHTDAERDTVALGHVYGFYEKHCYARPSRPVRCHCRREVLISSLNMYG